MGGLPFSRGALFHLLRNPIYLGRIPHKGIAYDGGHPAIVELELFEQVREQLDRQARRHRSSGEQRTARAPLTGKLFDATGEAMSPTFSRGKSGRLYRYYVSASLQQGGQQKGDAIRRLPATAFEKLVGGLVGRWAPGATAPLGVPLAVRLGDHQLLIDMPGKLAADIAGRLEDEESMIHSSRQACRIRVPIALPLRGGRRYIVNGSRSSNPDRALIAALRKAQSMVSLQRGLPFLQAAPTSHYDRELLRLAFLAPDLQRDILSGLQPPTLSRERLRQMDIPLCWKQQRQVLGWPQSA